MRSQTYDVARAAEVLKRTLKDAADTASHDLANHLVGSRLTGIEVLIAELQQAARDAGYTVTRESNKVTIEGGSPPELGTVIVTYSTTSPVAYIRVDGFRKGESGYSATDSLGANIEWRSQRLCYSGCKHGGDALVILAGVVVHCFENAR
jgi:hypothetical protein